MNQKGFIVPLIVIVVLVALTVGGYAYWQNQIPQDNGTNATPYSYEKKPTPSPTPSPQGVVCTQDAKQCPDGSYVSREGPICEFMTCPGEKQPPQSIIPADWKTYRNEKYGFEVRYPKELLTKEIAADCIATDVYKQQICDGAILFVSNNHSEIVKRYHIILRGPVVLSGGEDWIHVVKQYLSDAQFVENNINGNGVLTAIGNQSAKEHAGSVFSKFVYLTNSSKVKIVEFSLETLADNKSNHEQLLDQILSTFKFTK
ncbi:MAG: hypothetical protein Q8Q94_04020 [bacterium]|nr:hypothetical protein [bacterium]